MAQARCCSPYKCYVEEGVRARDITSDTCTLKYSSYTDVSGTHVSDRVNHIAYHVCVSEEPPAALTVAWFLLQGYYRLLGGNGWGVQVSQPVSLPSSFAVVGKQMESPLENTVLKVGHAFTSSSSGLYTLQERKDSWLSKGTQKG